jgi:hypothetical protein
MLKKLAQTDPLHEIPRMILVKENRRGPPKERQAGIANEQRWMGFSISAVASSTWKVIDHRLYDGLF